MYIVDDILLIVPDVSFSCLEDCTTYVRISIYKIVRLKPSTTLIPFYTFLISFIYMYVCMYVYIYITVLNEYNGQWEEEKSMKDR